MEEKNNEIDTLSTQLLDEQRNTIKVKKSLVKYTKKFTYRYKFPEKGCVYIMYDPNNKFCKHKIGISKNINQRLESDRTMIPTIKIKAIFYTQHYELFEKIIKIKHSDRLELPSHEWVFMELNELIDSYKEIDKACGFSSVIETNLWRYNLEDPVKLEEKTQGSVTQKFPSQIKKQPKNIPTYGNHLEENLNGMLPTRLLLYDYRIKTKEAPENQRYCNAFCQLYQPISEFQYRSKFLMTICSSCESMVDVAKIRIDNGSLTNDQIRADPSILKIEENEMVCRKCDKILDKSAFPDKRRQCKKCRYSVRSKNDNKFDDIISEEINMLQDLSSNPIELRRKLGSYIKTKLHKIITFLKLGRKYNDNKQTCLEKILEYLTSS